MYQKIIVIGYLGRDPEMRYMPDGTAVTNFSVASSRRWTDRNGQSAEETTWFRVSVWRKQAELANEYLSKGRMVLVEGRLQVDPGTGGPRLYTRNDGTIGSGFEIVADNIRFLGGRDGAAGGYDEEASYSGGSTGGGPAAQEEDDIPF